MNVAQQAATQRTMELQLSSFLAALAASSDATLSLRVRVRHCFLLDPLNGKNAAADAAVLARPIPALRCDAHLPHLLLLTLQRQAWPTKFVMLADLHADVHSSTQVVTVALDTAAMEVCVRLRGPDPCVLDSWNTSRLTGGPMLLNHVRFCCMTTTVVLRVGSVRRSPAHSLIRHALRRVPWSRV